KACYGTTLITIMGAAMLLVHRIPAAQAAAAALPLVTGGFFFTTVGLLLGFLARNQATARAYGTLVYLPLLVPVFTADTTPTIARWAPYFPSYRLWAGLDAALGSLSPWAAALPHAWWLSVSGLVAAGIASAVIGRRRF